MKTIITKDGSVTFHNEYFDETYHSTTGAIEEAFEKFAKPAGIKPGFRILDICFGLGYNSLAALYMGKDVRIVGLENDPEIINRIKDVEVPSYLKEDYAAIQKAAKTLETRNITIMIGDARLTIKKVSGQFDCVFLDPFSPKKCPWLWSLDFMKDIALVMKKGAVLTTYSCAGVVRRNLAEAGFDVREGPCVGRRSPSLVAVRK